MGDSYPARWLGEQLCAKLNPVLAARGFEPGCPLVWVGSPQETLTSVTWKCAAEELTFKYEFWGAKLTVKLVNQAQTVWTVRKEAHVNGVVAEAERILIEAQSP